MPEDVLILTKSQIDIGTRCVYVDSGPLAAVCRAARTLLCAGTLKCWPSGLRTRGDTQ